MINPKWKQSEVSHKQKELTFEPAAEFTIGAMTVLYILQKAKIQSNDKVNDKRKNRIPRISS